MVNIDLAQKYLDQEITREGAIYLAMARAAPIYTRDVCDVASVMSQLTRGQDLIVYKHIGTTYAEHGVWVIRGSRYVVECVDVGNGWSILSAREAK
jgi:hypothetical protein